MAGESQFCTARLWREALRVALGALLGLAVTSPTLWAQSAPVVISRNLFFEQADRPSRALSGGAELPLGPERVDVGSAAQLRLSSSSPTISAALRFRPLDPPGEGWALTVYITTHRADRDFYYLSQGQQAVQGALVPQKDYRADGLETALTAADGKGRMLNVREIVVQDDGQSELRLSLDGDTLRLAVVPPEAGGTPSPPRFVGGKGPPLRFLDYSLLVGGYSNNAFAQWWVIPLLLVRSNHFTDGGRTRAVWQVVVAQQAWRSERFSAWVEGGAAVSQKRNDKTHVTDDARTDLTWGTDGYWRYDRFGADLHVGGGGGPLLTQLLAGWQFSKTWGVVISWQHLKDFSGFGIGATVNW